MIKYLPFFLLTTSLYAGIHVQNLWRQNELSVCFAPAESSERNLGGEIIKARKWKEDQKVKVATWVQEEYSFEKTGIYFVGFTDCDETPDADVVLFQNKNSKIVNFFVGGLHGFATLGKRYESISGYPGALGYVTINTSGLHKSIVIHEFAHVAGLGHEHEHPDAFSLDKKRCDVMKKDQKEIWGYVYESYDAASVMNYCRLRERGWKGLGLSQKDAELLKKLYP